MKTITFNDKVYNVPTIWQEISLRQVIDTQILSDILPEAPLIAIIGGYVGIPIDEIKKSHVRVINEIVECLAFINEPYIAKPTNEFWFKDQRYSCKADLVEQEFQDWLSIHGRFKLVEG